MVRPVANSRASSVVTTKTTLKNFGILIRSPISIAR